MVCKITGHKDPRSLANYDPGIADLVKIDMAVGIATGGALIRGSTLLVIWNIIHIRHISGENVELPAEELRIPQ